MNGTGFIRLTGKNRRKEPQNSFFVWEKLYKTLHHIGKGDYQYVIDH